MRYRLTDAAHEDIRDIVDHIRYVQKSPQNAQLIAKRLKTQCAKLVEIPNSGTSARNSPMITRAGHCGHRPARHL